MPALDCDCPPLDGVNACSPLPLGFTRLRYFFGKRLGVADFVDEQLYHAAKMRFHNQHLHGAGVVCGLRISPQGATGARVGKGAALDRCGREVLVGFDQCIDVDAWIARERKARQAVDPSSTWPAGDLDAGGNLALAVVLRYSECSSSPEPAPRDPCACDNGGCDFGRVREGFELDLRTEAQAAAFVAPLSAPSSAALSGALAGAVSAQAFVDTLAHLVTAPAPDPSGEDWLVIGNVSAALDASQKTTAVTVLGAPPPPVLLESAVLQELLLRALGSGFEPGALADGAPQVTEVALSSDAGADTVGTNNVITLTLSGAVIAKTLPGAATINALDPVNGWSVVTGTGAPALVAGPPAQITIAAGTLAAPGLYRLSLPADPEVPPCDAQMRPLLPRPLSWSFAVDGTGHVTPASFA
jgi:hypothetical protein